MSVPLLKTIKILTVLFSVVFFLLYCEDLDETARDSAALDRLRSKEGSPVRVTDEDGVYGQYRQSDYEGPACNDNDFKKEKPDEHDKCIKICDKIYGGKSSCRRLPIDLISILDELFQRMEHIRAGEDQLSRSINSLDFGVMIDVDPEPVLILIDDFWGNREVAEFLIWTAKTPSVAEAIVRHDKESVILKEVFKTLGGSISKGMSLNLQGSASTFLILSMSEDKKNPAGFEAFHNVLKNVCTNRNCKMRVYCARERNSNRLQNRISCHYSSTSSRYGGFSRSDYCYLHGPNVWNYWQELNTEGRFRDYAHFPKNTKINEAECKKVCLASSCDP